MPWDRCICTTRLNVLAYFSASASSLSCPLGSNGTPRLGEQLAPFTGELNRYNPVWQNLELKEKLADHREARLKANDFSNGYKALLEEFESLRRSSDSKLNLQESNSMSLTRSSKAIISRRSKNLSGARPKRIVNANSRNTGHGCMS